MQAEECAGEAGAERARTLANGNLDGPKCGEKPPSGSARVRGGQELVLHMCDKPIEETRI